MEKIARSLGISELQVARQAIQCASNIPADSQEFWKRHVGYYLIDEGYELLLSKLGKPFTWRRQLRKGILKYRFGLYLSSILPELSGHSQALSLFHRLTCIGFR